VVGLADPEQHFAFGHALADEAALARVGRGGRDGSAGERQDKE
jgi:hypothetical protein